MPIYQTNLWICELCGHTEATVEETCPYSDPVVVPPGGVEWDYIGTGADEKLACPKCVAVHASPS